MSHTTEPVKGNKTNGSNKLQSLVDDS